MFLDVGIRGAVPAPLMAFGLLFASSYFSVITPQGGSQNVIFVGSGYLTQRELYRLGLLTTLMYLAVFLVIGTGWILLVSHHWSWEETGGGKRISTPNSAAYPDQPEEERRSDPLYERQRKV